MPPEYYAAATCKSLLADQDEMPDRTYTAGDTELSIAVLPVQTNGATSCSYEYLFETTLINGAS